ncbi:MAG: GHMP kinase [Bacteroidia bacterium]|nr:GHMP kinase [Bacteroidia bacterium]
MIISRTPLRMSFTGGGSDLPAFYQKYGGAVISSAIDKYVYVNVNKKFDNGIRISYSKTEEVKCVADIEHRLVRASLEYLGLKGGIEITTIADVPSKGTGLGSSSSFTVGLLHALNAYLGRYVSSEQLGSQSCHIEIDRCKEPIGKQDQYAAAYGGFNLIEFNPDNSVVVSPIICQRGTVTEIEHNLMVFYTGITRSASDLLARQSVVVSLEEMKQKALKRMVDLTYDLRRELQNNNTHVFGEILHENWMLKKSLMNEISSPEIDQWYDSAIRAGAIGGKILGAGAGGFLIFYVPRKAHLAVRNVLADLHQINIKFEPLGSRIIFYH